MKIDNRLIYIISGIVLALLIAFSVRLIFLSNSLIPDTEVNTDYEFSSQEQQIDSIGSTELNVNQQVESKVDTSDENNVDACDKNCLTSVIDKLISGKGLSEDDDGFSISDDNAKKIAELLNNDSSKLAEVETTLSSLDDQSSRDIILYIFSQLPDEQIQGLAQRLSSSENKGDRADSLFLLQSISNKNFDIQGDINQILSVEEDPEIILKAIKTSHSINPDFIDSTTKAHLSSLIYATDDEELKSDALITKMNVLTSDPSLQSDISNALDSSSERFIQAGLQALDNLLYYETEGRTDTQYQYDIALQKKVERIANDPSTDEYTRTEALNLIERNYKQN